MNRRRFLGMVAAIAAATMGVVKRPQAQMPRFVGKLPTAKFVPSVTSSDGTTRWGWKSPGFEESSLERHLVDYIYEIKPAQLGGDTFAAFAQTLQEAKDMTGVI